jgi:hypothetical protein
MALVIAVGHGTLTDPFTCSAGANDTDDLSTVDGALEVIHREQFPDTKIEMVRTWVDELLVVVDEDVVHHYSWEDGLGETIPEAHEEPSVEDFSDLEELEDESDSEDA